MDYREAVEAVGRSESEDVSPERFPERNAVRRGRERDRGSCTTQGSIVRERELHDRVWHTWVVPVSGVAGAVVGWARTAGGGGGVRA